MDKNKLIILALLALFFFNIVDGASTLWWTNLCIAKEANPLMYEALKYHPIAFIAIKFTLVNLGALILFRYRTHNWAIISIRLAFCFYLIVVIMHAYIAFSFYL